jgi:hypothetical protein
MIVYWPEKSAALRKLAIEKGHLQVRVQDITTDATRQQLEEAGGNKAECSICFEIFSLGTERAVSTCCGHIFGADCLQVWLDDGFSTCPYCRQQIYSRDVVPGCYRQEHAEYEDVLRNLQAHDRASDQFLREGNVDIHSEGFADHLNELSRLINEGNELLARIESKCRARPQA